MRLFAVLVGVVGVGLAACGGSEAITGDNNGTGGPDATVGTDAGGGGTDAASTVDVTSPVPVVRFASIGDVGKGNTEQKEVADAVDAKCKSSGCDFVVLLGDNVYDTGVSSTTDDQWKTKFEEPYKNIAVPFWAVLGNHDYGGNGTGTEPAKAQFQVDYTNVSPSKKWKMPAKRWHMVKEHVELVGLDTNEQMFAALDGRDKDQRADVKGWLAASTTAWRIALGHHPYKSNGPHGNAGSYEGASIIPVVNGKNVKEFMDELICGKVDLYLSGHDHSRQWIKDTCSGTELIVNGAGASSTELKGSNATHHQTNAIGFVYFVIEGRKLTAEFIDKTGKVEFARTLTK